MGTVSFPFGGNSREMSHHSNRDAGNAGLLVEETSSEFMAKMIAFGSLRREDLVHSVGPSRLSEQDN